MLKEAQTQQRPTRNDASGALISHPTVDRLRSDFYFRAAFGFAAAPPSTPWFLPQRQIFAAVNKLNARAMFGYPLGGRNEILRTPCTAQRDAGVSSGAGTRHWFFSMLRLINRGFDRGSRSILPVTY